MALPPGRGIHFDIYVGRDAVIFHFPVSFGGEKSEARSGDEAVVHQAGIAADADEAAPGAFAYERAEADVTEIPGQRVAAGAGKFIGDHYFGSVNSAERRGIIGAFARGPVIPNFPLHVLDDVVGGLATGVETLVNHGALLAELREIVAVEIVEAARAGVGKVNVSELAAAELGYFAEIIFHPGASAQSGFVRDWNDGDFARAGAIGARPDL